MKIEDIIETMFEAHCDTHFMATELVQALAEKMMRAVENDEEDSDFYISQKEIGEWRKTLDRIGKYYEKSVRYSECGNELEKQGVEHE